MSKGDRGRYIAAGLAACGLLTVAFGFGAYSYWLGNLSGYKEAETQRYQTEYAERTDQRVARCFNDATPARECVEKAIKDNHEQQRSERDLQAQRDMADWAFWMLIIASSSLAVTTIGTGFLAWQVKLTREAVDDTSKATNAMRDANRIAINAQRPWIDIDPIFKIGRNSGDTIEMHVGAKYENVGKSLACNFRYVLTFERGSREDFVQIEKALLAELLAASSESSLIPGKSITSENLYGGMTESAFKWDSDGHCRIAIMAIATYEIEGDDRPRWSSVIWTLRTKSEGDWCMGDIAWDDLLSGNVELEPRSRFNAT